MEGTVLCPANHAPLTPISFLERAALVYPDRPTVVVAVFAQNIPAFCELHFGIPMAGGVICALNSRLDAGMASVLLQRSEAKVVFVDYELLDTARLMSQAGGRSKAPHHAGHPYLEYEALLCSAGGGSPDFAIRWPADENEPIALNYTSGTTSRPKGVVYSHRGAYLNALACVLLNDMTAMPVYLWTVPMFHCNGWCLVWGGGTNVCLRKVSPAAIFDSVARHGVTHMGGARRRC
ncbi:putative acyl-activating enzyme 1, peroxisomal [Panicum miliaceum]|uniref:4-coumarate--CoA ligase n=1 Tax=Panicum miliaceum TaxID=4540 RepID=A0A3L6T377_PANMI|nr:putative acyl-activating enzyme 1, peroxisomal [Panicum miliaceum]